MLSKHHLTLFLFITLINNVTPTENNNNNNTDKQALLNFKAYNNILTNWNATTNPCTFKGITCTNNRVTKLVLENFNLQGSILPLTELTQLRVLSLKNNNLNGTLPDLSKLTSLKLLFLSHNDFSGSLSDSLVKLTRLYRLDLSFNDFSGEIPAELTRLTKLLTLRVEKNRFNGSIPELGIRSLRDFNCSGNLLSGRVPGSLVGFPESAFVGNVGLCGGPLRKCGDVESGPMKPGVGSGPVVAPPVVSSTPGDMPEGPESGGVHSGGKGGKISPVVLVVIIVGDVLVLGVITLLIFCFFWRSYNGGRKGSKLVESEKIVYSSSPYPGQNGDRGQMVFFEGVKRFELEDLLRASAEMLGKGGFGTAYKAVLDDGNVVAVKRLKDANVSGKREFEQHMEVLGRLKHQNVVTLKAYYFAREEKLLVYEYMPNGSLFWLLHGNRGPGRTPLDWTTRLKIAAGAARGLSFIHNSCKSLRLIHGNIKSTNVLIDKSGNACVSDFGLAAFAPPATATTARSNGYRAPETIDGRKLTQKSDVYSFGVLLLELLTGKCPNIVDGNSSSGFGGAVDLPRWVQSVVREEWTAEVFDLELMRYKDIEEEMVGLLQIAMACTSASPDQRPKISQVVKMIEDIRGVEVSPCHDDSVSESPSISEDTCGPN